MQIKELFLGRPKKEEHKKRFRGHNSYYTLEESNMIIDYAKDHNISCSAVIRQVVIEHLIKAHN